MTDVEILALATAILIGYPMAVLLLAILIDKFGKPPWK